MNKYKELLNMIDMIYYGLDYNDSVDEELGNILNFKIFDELNGFGLDIIVNNKTGERYELDFGCLEDMIDTKKISDIIYENHNEDICIELERFILKWI